MVNAYFRSGGRLLSLKEIDYSDVDEARDFVVKFLKAQKIKLESEIYIVISGNKLL